jgi:hypothetical protein
MTVPHDALRECLWARQGASEGGATFTLRTGVGYLEFWLQSERSITSLVSVGSALDEGRGRDSAYPPCARKNNNQDLYHYPAS